MKHTILFSCLIAAGISLSTSACVPLAVGGAAAGGYYVGQDTRSAKQIASDAALTAKINAAYASDPRVDNWRINVDSYNGVATLNGRVPSKAMINQAVYVARRVEGVRGVTSNLEIAR